MTNLPNTSNGTVYIHGNGFLTNTINMVTTNIAIIEIE